eukprot:118948_1
MSEQYNTAKIYGASIFYPFIPLNNVTNIIYENDKRFIPIDVKHPLKQHDNICDSEIKIHWTSRKGRAKISGDLDLICKLVGHNGSRCKFPSFLCDINKDAIRSCENVTGSIQNNCQYRTNKSVWNNFNIFQKNKKLPQSKGIGNRAMIPIYPWCFTLPTFHIPARTHGECNVGIKIHYLVHLLDMIRFLKGMRLAMVNEERTEHMIKFVVNALKAYKHYYGDKKLMYGMRNCNIKSVCCALVSPHLK